MGNTLTAVIPKILAMGLMALREQAIMPQLVNRAYSTDAGKKGSTIDVPQASAVTAVAVAPAATPQATGDQTPTSVSIALSQWYEAAFEMTDKDLQEAEDGFLPMQASQAIRALANNVDSYILGFHTGVYGWVNEADTWSAGARTFVAPIVPFVSTTATITTARTILNKQLAPLNDRRVVLNPDSEGNALSLPAFQYAAYAGNTGVIGEGQIGRKLGFDFAMDQNVPSHTSGTITTGLIAKAATAVALGVQSILVTTAGSSGACALVIGDIVQFAGHTQTYVVTAACTQAAAASDATLAFAPGLKKALVGSEAITVAGSHAVNLAFHRDAFAFASRPLEGVDGLGSLITSAVDPISGLALRLEVSREHKRTRWSYDILYGAQLIRPELACRIASIP